MLTGIVYKSTGSTYIVKAEGEKFFECRIKGKFRLKEIKNTNPIAVGDIVDFELDNSSDQIIGQITNIHQRKNYIVRKSVNLSKQTHIIASNIDCVFLLVTVNYPTTTTSFIDRFLATSEAYQIKTFIIFNKIDKLEGAELDNQLFLEHIYTSIGYECFSISATQKTGIEPIIELMKGKTCMFAGHSGVGKSTLVNVLDPNLSLKTNEISQSQKQGQHTTTFAQMYDLAFGAKIIDTPGIKGFGMVEMQAKEITDYFPEFFRLKDQCKFSNCLHKDEPGCAVKKALERNEIFWSRYRSYIQILEGEHSIYRISERTD